MVCSSSIPTRGSSQRGVGRPPVALHAGDGSFLRTRHLTASLAKTKFSQD
jgi:hypothetical protein